MIHCFIFISHFENISHSLFVLHVPLLFILLISKIDLHNVFESLSIPIYPILHLPHVYDILLHSYLFNNVQLY